MELLNTEKCIDRYLRTLDPCALKCSWQEEGILSRHERIMIKSLPFRNYFANFFRNNDKKFRRFQKCLHYSLSKLKLRSCDDANKVLACVGLVQSKISVRGLADLFGSSDNYAKKFIALFGVKNALNSIFDPIVDEAGSALEKIIPTKVSESAGTLSDGFFNLTGSIKNSVGNLKNSTINFVKLVGSTTKNLITGATSSASDKVEKVVNVLTEQPTTPGSDIKGNDLKSETTDMSLTESALETVTVCINKKKIQYFQIGCFRFQTVKI